MARALAGVLVAGLCVLLPTTTHAQDPDSADAPVDSVIIAPEVPVSRVPAEDSVVRRVSPGGAFIRSLVVPGWGQAAYDANVRGGIYFAGWAGNWFMLFRTYTRLGEARSRYDRRADQLVDSLLTTTENPDSVRALLENPNYLEGVVRADQQGDDLRKLVNAREQQREDWVAWSIFWLLASGVDAFVTAHLSDFPGEVDLQPRRDGSFTAGVRVPVGGVP
ncbi:MAG TPA: DUF5683 domain-containing protein [Longimicrobiales bacterium]|nr:DUF5683 domain-containing protein [Longimicrobiales bacterium]